MSPKKELFPVLQNVTIFAGIESEALRRLYEDCKVVEYGSGDYILTQGTPATEIYVILRGSVKIVLERDGENLELVKLEAGHCVGEASVIGVQQHSASAYCVEDTVLLELSRAKLMDISKYDKDLFSLLILNIARELARRLYRTDQILLHYGDKPPHHNPT